MISTSQQIPSEYGTSEKLLVTYLLDTFINIF